MAISQTKPGRNVLIKPPKVKAPKIFIESGPGSGYPTYYTAASHPNRVTVQRNSKPENTRPQRNEHGAEHAVQSHRQARISPRLRIDAERPRCAEAVRGDADREAALPPLAAAYKIEHVARENGAEDAGGYGEDRGQGRRDADPLGDAHRDRRGDGFGDKAAHDRRIGAEQARKSYRAHDRGQAAGKQRGEQRHEPPAHRAEPLVDRHRERDRRGSEQEVDELRTLEVLRIRHVDQRDRRRDENDRDQHRVRERMPVRPLVDDHAQLVRAERENEREQRTPREVDPDLVNVGKGRRRLRVHLPGSRDNPFKTSAVTAMVSTTLTRSAAPIATAWAFRCGQNITTPTAAGTNSSPKCWLNTVATSSSDAFTPSRRARKQSSRIRPTTGPGINGKKKCVISSPSPWKRRICTRPGIMTRESSCRSRYWLNPEDRFFGDPSPAGYDSRPYDGTFQNAVPEFSCSRPRRIRPSPSEHSTRSALRHPAAWPGGRSTRLLSCARILRRRWERCRACGTFPRRRLAGPRSSICPIWRSSTTFRSGRAPRCRPSPLARAALSAPRRIPPGIPDGLPRPHVRAGKW